MSTLVPFSRTSLPRSRFFSAALDRAIPGRSATRRGLATLCALITLAVVAAVSATPALAEKVTRRLDQSYFVGSATELEIDLILGSLEVRGSDDGRNVTVELILTCSRDDDAKCQRRANRIVLEPRISGNKLALRLDGTARGQAGGIQAEMIVRSPRDLTLEIDLAGGNVLVEGMRSHVEIDSGGGDVDFVGSQDAVKTFKADVGFGVAHLWLRDSKVEASGFPRSITWRGSGTAEVEIDLGGGNMNARLE